MKNKILSILYILFCLFGLFATIMGIIGRREDKNKSIDVYTSDDILIIYPAQLLIKTELGREYKFKTMEDLSDFVGTETARSLEKFNYQK